MMPYKTDTPLTPLVEHYANDTGVEKRDCAVTIKLTDAEYKKLTRLAYTCGGSRQLAMRNLIHSAYAEATATDMEARQPSNWTTMHVQFRSTAAVARYLSGYRSEVRSTAAKRLIKLGLAYLKAGNYHAGMFRSHPKRDSLTSCRLDGDLLTALDKSAIANGMPIRTYLGILLDLGMKYGVKEK